MQRLVTTEEGKKLIETCLTAPSTDEGEDDESRSDSSNSSSGVHRHHMLVEGDQEGHTPSMVPVDAAEVGEDDFDVSHDADDDDNDDDDDADVADADDDAKQG